MFVKVIKTLAWKSCRFVTKLVRFIFVITGQRREIDVLIYKVDRLGDWFLVEPSLMRVVERERACGRTVVVWCSKESSLLHDWRRPDLPIERVVFEPKGMWAKLARTWSLTRLLARYKAKTLVCFRHGPDPIRDFVLAAAAVEQVYALSWRIFPGRLHEVPYEIERHQLILRSLGIGVRNTRELLPAIERVAADNDSRVVVAPFSSAEIKDWIPDYWREVAQTLISRGRLVELWVGPDQLQRARQLAKVIMEGTATTVSVHSGTFAELEGAVASACVTISVDTFAAHLATAMDVPAVCIVGGGQLGDFAPWRRSERQIWLYRELPCHGCGWRCSQTSVRCIGETTARDVLAAVDVVIATPKT